MKQQGAFGERLRHLREAAGFSQETLAERAGLSANAISSLERGERKRPYPDTVRRIADALGLTDEERRALVASAHQPKSHASLETDGQPALPQFRLPAEPDALLGRDHEVEVTRHLLLRPETHLLTLTGPGGIGKTRLALRIARLSTDVFPDGAVWVDLAPLTDASLLLPSICEALGIRVSPTEPATESVRSTIGSRTILLVLDNMEHLRDAAPEVADLLRAGDNLKILATSRAPLDIRGEQEYIVPPLPLPMEGAMPGLERVADVPSVQLFVRAVQRKQPAFEPDPAQASAMAEIVRRLDGVPLALELAAARVPMLGVPELLARLDHALPLLTGGKRDLPSRQRTMESTIGWSYDLLQDETQRLFRLLSVFSGGWTLDAAETVVRSCAPESGDVIDGIARLIDHSLVRRVDDRHGRVRYTMLGTFREFGRDRLRDAGEEPGAVHAHLCWITGIAEAAEPHLLGPAQDFWLDQLESELDNVRAALGSDDDASGGDRLRLAASFWRFWYMRGRFAEGLAWLDRCLQSPRSAGNEITAKALNGAGILAQESGDFARAETFYGEALELRRASGDERGVAYTLSSLGLLADHRGDYDRAISLYEESLTLCRKVDHKLGAGNALNNLGLVYRDLADFARAREVHEESLAVLREIGDQRSIANALNNLGNIATDTGDLARATSLHQESLGIRRRLDDRPGIAMSLKNLGTIARLQGDTGEAARLYRESLEIRSELSDVLGAIPTLGEVAALASATGSHAVACELVCAVQNIRERLGAPEPPALRRMQEDILRDAEIALAPDHVAGANRRGRAFTGEQAIAQALAFLIRM